MNGEEKRKDLEVLEKKISRKKNELSSGNLNITPISVFSDFFPDSIFNFICIIQINLLIHFNQKHLSNSKKKELKNFFGLLLLMGISKNLN